MANNRNVSGPQVPRSGMGSSPAMNDIMQRYQSVMPQAAAAKAGPQQPALNNVPSGGTNMDQWAQGMKGEIGANRAAYNPMALPTAQQGRSYPFAQGSTEAAYAGIRYANDVNANGLKTDYGAQQSVANNGYMPKVTVGGAYGQSANAYDGYNKMHGQENAQRDALTEAMRARADRVGLYSNAQRERDAVDVNAAEAQRASQIGLSLPLSVAPPPNPMRGDQSKVGPRYSARAMPSEDYAQEMAGRNALVNMRGIQRGQDRLMRMGQTPIGAMTSPLYQQQVMNSQLNESRDLAGLRNEGQWGDRALQGMNQLGAINAQGQSNIGLAGVEGANALNLAGVNNASQERQYGMGLQARQMDINANRQEKYGDRQYNGMMEGFTAAEANIQGLMNSGKMSPQDGMAALNNINSQRQQTLGQQGAGMPFNGQMGMPNPATGIPQAQGQMSQGGLGLLPQGGGQPQAPSLYPNPSTMNYDKTFMGGKANQQQFEAIQAAVNSNDIELAQRLAARDGISPGEVNKLRRKNISMFNLTGDVRTPDGTNLMRIDPATGLAEMGPIDSAFDYFNGRKRDPYGNLIQGQ